jgi:hypothetical protein
MCNGRLLGEIWCQVPEHGEVIGPKHAALIQKTVGIIYRIVHLLALGELLTALCPTSLPDVYMSLVTEQCVYRSF